MAFQALLKVHSAKYVDQTAFHARVGHRGFPACAECLSSRHAVRREEFEAWRAVFEPFFTIDVLIDEDAIRELPGLPPMPECGFQARATDGVLRYSGRF